MFSFAQAVACAPKLHGVAPSCGVSEATELTLFGENLAAGTQLYVGGGLVSDATPNEDGTVRQVWEISRDHGINWRSIFDGLYKPRS